MGASQFVPLEADLIDEGRFLQNVNDALRLIQVELCRHAKEHGDKAIKAKAEVGIKISLQCLQPDKDVYSCAATIKTTLPSAPAAVTLLIGGETQTGEDALFCRKSGSTEDHPAQAKLATKDGRTIDMGTGEIMAESD